MKKTKWVLVIFLTYTLSGFSQNLDTLKLRAAMIVHTDFENFFINKNEYNIEEIHKNYIVIILESKGVNDSYFFKVKNKNCDCVFYIMYNLLDKNFYRLSGFKYSEFSDFYNYVLIGGNIAFSKEIKNPKKRLKYIIDNVTIEAINIQEYYNMYYNKAQNSLVDKSSCFRKSIINEYMR